VNASHRVLLLDTAESTPNHYLCLGVEQALRAHPRVESVVRAGHRDAVRTAQEQDFTLFLAFRGETLNRPICERLAALCSHSAIWLTEDPYEQPANLEHAPLFDLVFTNDSGSAGSYGPSGRHLPLAAAPELCHRPVREREADYRYDLLFIGTAWPNRVSLVRELLAGLPGRKIKVALPHNPHLPEPHLPLPRSSYDWRTSFEDFARLANRSRLVLTLHRSFSSSGGGVAARTPGPRLFETALAGGCQLVDAALPETEAYFTPEAHYAPFRDASECLAQARRLLDDPDRRMAMARAAQAHALAEHCFGRRVETLLGEVERLGPAARPPAVPRARRRVLFTGHNVVGVRPFGGVEVYQQVLATGLRDDHEVLYYTPDRSDATGRTYLLRDSELRVQRRVEVAAPHSRQLLTCGEREARYAELLRETAPDLVHYHHFIGHVPSLPFISHALGVPSVYSANDFYAVCDDFNLMHYDGRHCNTFELPVASCDVCWMAREELPSGSQSARRAFFARALAAVDVLHFNTAGIRRLFTQMFPRNDPEASTVVRGLPIPAAEAAPARPPARRPLRVAAVGNFTRIKGAEVMIRAFNELRSAAVHFDVYGAVDHEFGPVFEALKLPNVTLHGGYEPGALRGLLAEADLSLHVSIWPETYVLTLSEAWQAGVVPIVADIGALGERVTDGANGFKIAPQQAGVLVQLLRNLIAEPERIDAARAGIRPDLWVTESQHVATMREVYDRLCARWTAPGPAAGPLAAHHRPVTLERCGVLVRRPVWVGGGERPLAPFAGDGAGASVLHRLRAHLRRHGMLQTGRKVMTKLRDRYGRR
jgi:glycosyltransferase involved in cell wall biosynthesis